MTSIAKLHHSFFCLSYFIIWLLKLFKFIDDDGDISFINANEIWVVKQTLDSQKLLLFLLFDNTHILAELDEVTIKLLLSLLSFKFAKNQIDLIPDSHSLVLFFIVDTIGNRIGWLALDESSHLILLLIHSFLSSNKLLEFVNQVLIFLLIRVLVTGTIRLAFNMRCNLLLVSIFFHLLRLLLSLQTFI